RLNSGAMQHNALHHLAHLRGSVRRNYPALVNWMERNGLRCAVRLSLGGHDSRCDIDAIVRHRGNEANKLQGSNSNLLPHGNRSNGHFRPAAWRFGETARFSRKLNSSLLTESESTNVFVETIVS